MRTLHFVVSGNESRTVKSLLYERGFSGSVIRLLKQYPDGITLDDCPVRVIDQADPGQCLTVRLHDDQRCAQPGGPLVPVAYDDEDIMVLNKPAGMPVHPVHEYRRETLANAFAAHLAQRGKAAAFRPINRLDRNTSGLVVAALHKYAACRLSGTVDKVYLAVCCGHLTGQGIIDAPLRIREGYGIQREVGEGGQRAVTRWQSLSVGRNFTLVRVIIETGRTHQIRAHFSHIGYPLAGDDMYGGVVTPAMERQALHCAQVTCCHPVTHQSVCCRSPLPDDMAAFAHSTGLLPDSTRWLTDPLNNAWPPGHVHEKRG